MGTVFVDNLEPQSGTSLTLGASGDTVSLTSGAKTSGFGKVGQVVSTAKTDTFSTTSTSSTDITGMSVSITPTSTSSKILMMTNYVVQAAIKAFEKIDVSAGDLFMEVLTDQILEDPMLAEDSAEVLKILKDKDASIDGDMHIDEMQWKNLVTRMQHSKSMEEE